MSSKSDRYYAAIDLGTNSCRLVIADRHGKYVYKDTVSTKLGEGMFAQNKLTDEPRTGRWSAFIISNNRLTSLMWLPRISVP